MSFGSDLASLGVGQARVHCNNCGTDLTALIHIACSVCADFDLCLQCFAGGAELGTHKNHHDFTVRDNCTFPVLVEDWGADEEMLLLEAVEQHGIGNWDEIAHAVGSKTAQEVKDHLEKVNLESFGSFFIPHDFHKSFMDKSGGAECSAPDEQSPLHPIAMPEEDAKQLGYWPNRDDFDYDYKTDAEGMVSYLDIALAEEEDLERACKLDHINMYNESLMERALYKRMAKEHHLFPAQQVPAPKKKKHKREEKDLNDMAPLINRLLKPKEYEKFLASLAKERAVRDQIKDLVRYRNFGITSLAGCAQYEELSLQREVSKACKAADSAQQSDSKPGTESPPSNSGSSSKTQASRKLRAVIRLSKSSHLTGVKQSKDGTDFKLSRAAAYLSQNERKLCSGLGLSPSEYITAKTIIIRDTKKKHGHGCKTTVTHLPHLSAQQKGTLVMFFKGHGWL